MKGFKKDGKFRPTENRSKSSLSKTDIKKNKFGQSAEAIENQHSIAIKRKKNSMNEEHEIGTKWCSGKHKCQICGKKFDCTGTGYGHDSKFSESQCHGEYEQFCENHTVEEYTKKHKELGELDKKSFDDTYSNREKASLGRTKPELMQILKDKGLEYEFRTESDPDDEEEKVTYVDVDIPTEKVLELMNGKRTAKDIVDEATGLTESERLHYDIDVDTHLLTLMNDKIAKSDGNHIWHKVK